MASRAVNDFTIRVATVNGSGSQSSNLVLTNAIFRLGVPVAPKNVFPSNIEGLPTWFDVRVTAQGYRCRTRDVDLLVALNSATWQQDVASVKPGGAIVHESTYPLTGPTQRDDLTYYAVPFAALAKEHFADKGDLRKYLMNMIYVGVVAALLGIPPEVVEEGLRTQFRTKEAAVELNMNAVRVGLDYAKANIEKRDHYYLEKMSGKTEGYMFMEGNRAAALGCVMGGCTVAAWYPITPSSSLCEYFIAYCDRYRAVDGGKRTTAIVQAEDELAAAGIVFGAGWAGARAMTSTSGPGISLMAEYAGYGYFAELPGVIFDIQRAGPSTGLPTRTMQGDVAFAYTLSHGDTKHIVLLPATVRECYEFAMEAFDLADRLQTPVFVLSDLDLGMNSWLTKPLSYPKTPFDRGKILSADDLASMKTWGRYRDVDKDGIPYRTLPGTKHPNAGFFTRGTGHDEEARYSEQPEVWQRNLDRLLRKLETARTTVPAPIVDEKGNKVAILAYGTTHHAVVEARDLLHDAGIDVDYMRVRALPLSPEVATFVKRHDRVYIVEQNRDAQLYGILRTELPTHLIGRLESICHYNGVPIDAHAVFDPLFAAEHEPAVVAE